MIRFQRRSGDKPGDLWMICEDTNHGDSRLIFLFQHDEKHALSVLFQ